VITDDIGAIGMTSPVIYLIRCKDRDRAEEEAKKVFINDHEYGEDIIEDLDVFAFEVTDADIIEVED
jgi:hypothetical protein